LALIGGQAFFIRS